MTVHRVALTLVTMVVTASVAAQPTLRHPAGDPLAADGITTAGEAQKAGMVSLIVERNPGTQPVAARIGAVVSRQWPGHEVIRVPQAQADAIQKLLAITEGVERVERDSVVMAPEPELTNTPTDRSGVVASASTSATPDDPEYQQQLWWESAETYAGASGVESAWRIAELNERLSIAVIDGGFDNHPDFEWAGGISLVGDGRGHLSYDPESCTTYHGQSVASIIGATPDNGSGMSGMVDADFYAVRALACDNSGYMSDIIRSIRWAAGEDVGAGAQLSEAADVINLSLGARTSCTSSLQSAIDAANAAGAVVVASSGNDGEDASNAAPANCNGVVTVGAVTAQGDQASFSNYGEAIDISTLGRLVRVQGPSGHRWVSGTSFSAPIASGIVALLRQDVPELDRSSLLALIPDAVTPLGSTTNAMGAGVFNAPKLQQAAAELADDTPLLRHAVRARPAYADSLFEHMDSSRLCSLHEFKANNLELPDGKAYTVFEVPRGVAKTVSNGKVVAASEDTGLLLEDLSPGTYQYGLQFCSEGTDCDSESLLDLETGQIAKPERCGG